MTARALLARLEAVRETSRGFMAKCPAHPDRHPSLSIREGERALLVKCWGGCSLQEIMTALGLHVADLFFDSRKGRYASGHVPPKRWRFDWRRTAAGLQDYAIGLFIRAERTLAKARQLDHAKWTETDFDAAVNAVTRAYIDLERADLLEDVACRIRLHGLRKETERRGSRRAAA